MIMSLPRRGFPSALGCAWPGSCYDPRCGSRSGDLVLVPLGTNCTNIVDRLFCGGNASPNFSLRLCQNPIQNTVTHHFFACEEEQKRRCCLMTRKWEHVTRAWRWGTPWKFASSFHPIPSLHPSQFLVSARPLYSRTLFCPLPVLDYEKGHLKNTIGRCGTSALPANAGILQRASRRICALETMIPSTATRWTLCSGIAG